MTDRITNGDGISIEKESGAFSIRVDEEAASFDVELMRHDLLCELQARMVREVIDIRDIWLLHSGDKGTELDVFADIFDAIGRLPVE